MVNLEEAVMIWVTNNHKWKTKYFSKPVDFIHSKLFNTFSFYFINEEDEEWLLNQKKEEYSKWCEEDDNRIFKDDRLYSTFIDDLFISTEMVEKMLNGNNPKRIKQRRF